MAAPEAEKPGSTEPGTDSQASDPPHGICAAFDSHLDKLLSDPRQETFRGLFTGDVDPDDPFLRENDGPFGEAWHALVTKLVDRDPSDQQSLVETEEEIAELNQLSASQCGYPILSAIATITCAPDAGGEPSCEEPTDPRAEYRRFQQTADRVEAYFEAGGSNWLSEIPGEGIAARRSYDASGEPLVRIEVLIRIDEDQVPELGLWIAGFSEFNNFDFDNLDSLRDPLFWEQVNHRATNLSIAVVGGLFGIYELPTNPDGMELDVRTLASPKLDPTTSNDTQDLYLIGSELPTSLLSDEEILPFYQGLAANESLVLVSVS